EPLLDGQDAGEKYVRLYRKLIIFFEAREDELPDEAADQTLDRVGRHVEEGREISHLAAYVWGVAKYVHLERLKRRQLRVQEDAQPLVSSHPDGRKEAMLSCCDTCLEILPPDQRELLTRFFTGDGRVKIEGRKALATQMGISANALSIRISRLKDRLEECITACMEKRST